MPVEGLVTPSLVDQRSMLNPPAAGGTAQCPGPAGTKTSSHLTSVILVPVPPVNTAVDRGEFPAVADAHRVALWIVCPSQFYLDILLRSKH